MASPDGHGRDVGLGQAVPPLRDDRCPSAVLRGTRQQRVLPPSCDRERRGSAAPDPAGRVRGHGLLSLMPLTRVEVSDVSLLCFLKPSQALAPLTALR